MDIVILNPSGLYKSIVSIGIKNDLGRLTRVYSPGLSIVEIELSGLTMYWFISSTTAKLTIKCRMLSVSIRHRDRSIGVVPLL